jgi:hypothetical protein
MSYKHREPVPELEMASIAEMERARYAGHHTICQTLRDIYGMIDNEEAKNKCRLAVAMAKAMHEKLKWYNQNYKPDPERPETNPPNI